MKLSSRVQNIEPFYVMAISQAATQLAQKIKKDAETCSDAKRLSEIKPMIFLNIGEPDFTAPPLVQEAAIKAIKEGRTQYTHALGLPALRERISQWYKDRFDLDIPIERIAVTSGASSALQLACLTLIDAGDEVLMPDPSYPCNRHFVSVSGGRAVLLPTNAKQRFQLTLDQVKAAWNPQTKGVVLASPSNPTGTSIHPHELEKIHRFVQSQNGFTLLDEIYLGLSFDSTFGRSALAIDDKIISINSFSKYFNMTGWRLGWMVLPASLTLTVECLAQHLFICPNTIAQYAALACFESESLKLYEDRRLQFKERRDFFIPALEKAGFSVPVRSDGAFYVWADCSLWTQKLNLKGSWELAFYLMENAHIAVTPGRDFGIAEPERFIRFSTANSLEQLQEAAKRLEQLFESL